MKAVYIVLHASADPPTSIRSVGGLTACGERRRFNAVCGPEAMVRTFGIMLDGGQRGMTLRVGGRRTRLRTDHINGEQITLSAFRGRPVVVVFLRWLG